MRRNLLTCVLPIAGAQEFAPVSVEQIRQRVPQGVKYIPDRAYREGNPAWRADIAMPAGDGPACAGIVFVHGGGWVTGDKRMGHSGDLPLEVARLGFVAISVNYRLATKAPMPACIEDVKCAVRWFRAHANEFRLDPNRVGAYGYSAGAHLVAMLALAGPEAGLEGDGPYQDLFQQPASRGNGRHPYGFAYARPHRLGSPPTVRRTYGLNTRACLQVLPAYLGSGQCPSDAPAARGD